jgi:hypothetical protein
VAEDTAKINRAERFTSHALVEVRKFRWFPFGTESAVLLDMSTGGFKVEFTGETSVKPGGSYWLDIPLSPLGIRAPNRLLCQAECKWFDEKRFRFGGVFTGLKSADKILIDQIVEVLKSRGYSIL